MKTILTLLRILAAVAVLILAIILIGRNLPFVLTPGVVYDGPLNKTGLRWSNASIGAEFEGSLVTLDANGAILFEFDQFDISGYETLTIDLTAMEPVQVRIEGAQDGLSLIDLPPTKRNLTIDLNDPDLGAGIRSISIESATTQNFLLNQIYFSAENLEAMDATAEAISASRFVPGVDRPVYGIEYVPPADYELVKEFGVEITLQDFWHDGTPEDWLNQLDVAEAADMQIVAWLWPPGYEYVDSEWEISSQQALFIETVAGHPALFAIYGLHEPYWNGCRGCGYTTAELQKLYLMIKNIADVPVFNDMDELGLWKNRGAATTIADGVCDYCGTWYYPAETDDSFNIRRMERRLAEDIAVLEEHAPNSKLFWAMQSFATGEPFNKRMPTADEMKEIAEVTFKYADQLGGMWWYPWDFDPDEYHEVLSNRTDLHPVLLEIYTYHVQPMRDQPQ